MRNLNECRAEVFRRSEARIKARKRRRNAILTACVPVALCVALIMAVGLPGNADQPAAEKGLAECATEPAGAMDVDSPVSLGSSVVRVEVEGMGFDLTHTEPEKVAQIAKQLHDWKYTAYGITLPPPEGTTPPDGANQNGEEDDVVVMGFGEGITITLVMNQGEGKAYTLLGDCLTEEDTGRTCVLTQSQSARLAELLGITLKEDKP